MTNLQEAETEVAIGNSGTLTRTKMDIGINIRNIKENYILLC